MKLYNTLTRKVEEFKPMDPSNVRLYACGPTVYDYQHIGHMRRYVGDDILIRVLEFNGYKVKHVMNITDVGHLTSDSDTGEDKMEKGAKKLGLSVWDVAKKFESQFWDSIEKLNVKKSSVVMHATDYIKEQIDLIKILEEKGFTYRTSDGVYFDTSKFPGYAKLSGQKKEELKAGVRVEMGDKKNPTDFALWKFSVSYVQKSDNSGQLPGNRQMEWWFEGPFSGQPYKKEQWLELDKMFNENKFSKTERDWFRSSVGFPGWHIECSTMSMAKLGPTLDIHTGGIDHIAIHHTNEIAQSEAATGKEFVRYWIHHNFLLVQEQKMSKSLGNIFTVEDVIKKDFDPLALRYLYLQTHYRQEMNFTWESLTAAQTALNRLREEVAGLGKPEIGCAEFEQRFLDAVNEDLNMPKALAVVWEVLKSDYPESAKAESLYKFDKVLGFKLSAQKSSIQQSQDKDQKQEIPEEVWELVKERKELRKQKKFHLADQIRDKIKKMGYEIIDREKGQSEVKKI